MSDKKIAVITGASRGIGAGIAKRLAKDGFFTVLNFASSEAKAKSVLDEIVSAGGEGVLCGFDVSNSQEVDERFSWITKEIGTPSVLVNNAGITIDGLLLRMKDADLDKTLNIDLKGAIFCTRAVAKPMMKARKGSIIQISSVIGEMGNAGQTAYAAAKAGLIGFTKSAAKELASRNIRVNTVTPGFIATDMTQDLTGDQKEAIVQSIPLGNIGQPEDIAGVTSFLASDDSRYVTGQVIGVSGGLYM